MSSSKLRKKIRNRIAQILPLCSNITKEGQVSSFYKEGSLVFLEYVFHTTGSALITAFPAEYLSMSMGAIEIAEKARRIKEAEEEAKRQAKEEAEKELAEREEYERLKKKFG